MTIQKEEKRQNRVLMEIIDNTEELPMESQNLLLILARGMVFTRNCMTWQNVVDQPRMPSDEHPT